nr:hypothetical protein [Crucivirus sp.]
MFKGVPGDKLKKAQKTLKQSNFQPLKDDTKFEDWDMDLRCDEPEAQEIKPTSIIDPKDQAKLGKEFHPQFFGVPDDVGRKKSYALPTKFANESRSLGEASAAGDVICGEELFVSICECAVDTWLEEHATQIVEKYLENFNLVPKKKQKKM